MLKYRIDWKLTYTVLEQDHKSHLRLFFTDIEKGHKIFTLNNLLKLFVTI